MIRWLVNKIKRHDVHSKMFYYGNKYLRTLSQEDLDKFHKYAHQLEGLEGNKMLERDEKIIDFEVYKYSIPNIINITALLVVLLITLVLYIICLPFIWFTPTHRLFIYFECLIKELT